ncbi:uncharacterized protein TRIADDRAFT_57900 [Trichoplax adhaerens]|uniref:Uncharacterized protein n=1 Tax=Trichoplax adhaerens TaxID=10228 RepID=B3S224_TRIAD|nr:hypothetical protein TRIADDRAFT_57900 [Trichoplax adhaerens]EDV23358.1 hypothetical protein TRIADDRAFT_57900 [Trichoplax adhaerens]|eukprot:XP_002114268.1 hypothetical protein TRIADDRAFT_57900 [Trichoplax adhaerens]
MAPTSNQNDESQANTILFNVSKRELFSPTNGFKIIHRSYKDELNFNKINQSKVIIFAGPRDKFTASEFDAIRNYIDQGGSVLVMLGEGGESNFDTNINFLLEDYGIMVNNDTVVRTSYYKYFHPKEVFISNGVLNREINRAAGKIIPGSNTDDESVTSSPSIAYVYPFGATLAVGKPAIAVLSTGSTSFPLNRPVCAFHSSKKSKGKLAVIGSVHIFSDTYIDKEENSKFWDILLRWLTTDEIKLNNIDAEDPELTDYHALPDITKLSEKLRVCLQESDEIPRDISQMFDHSLFQFDTTTVPDAVRAYTELSVKHEPLTLITPQFETPLPPLRPAVFPPQFRELPPPSLDLFDLDDYFSSERVRLAQITNKCNDNDLEYYIRECGDILGVTKMLPPQSRDAKRVLEYVFSKVVEFKKLNQEDAPIATNLEDPE